MLYQMVTCPPPEVKNRWSHSGLHDESRYHGKVRALAILCDFLNVTKTRLACSQLHWQVEQV